ncbi:bombyxin A-3 homolog [Bicyclus anynana]|uniref:Bombyxin A-3 homolog n=1 Tax=Bicyclus anynana TaxID=110368 RepID=A0A6J1MHR4_BICAN|nr:bombyxin A-3 homolog [Bicyclus anynana]
MRIQVLMILSVIASMYLTPEAQVQKYCGRRLAVAVSLVCEEVGNSGTSQKRSSQYEYDEDMYTDTEDDSVNDTLDDSTGNNNEMDHANDDFIDDSEDLSLDYSIDNSVDDDSSVKYEIEGPWITAQKALTIVRGKRQIVSECCDKPCSVDELKTYC